MMRVLLLGGTTEASLMAQALARTQVASVFSYAGRTARPVAQPLPTRVGGFGGVTGLITYMQEQGITHVVDATHPFAAGMSRNAFAACAKIHIPLIRLEREAWQPQAADDWRFFDTIAAIPPALPQAPARVFLAIGKQQIGQFAHYPQHHYVLRLVDTPAGALPLPKVQVEIARGPFDLAGDLALLRRYAITHVVAKNSGGAGARAKLDAARKLGLPVLMAQRPAVPGSRVAGTIDEALHWLDHVADRGV
ncbi:cobalt-precorrin-6A reductase [Sulfitobacter sp. F26204]|uniref:cobalt-precorrin-6A reductase n=1 Tax=Sulfitobacter sp. F26204 TaxID=2996014 RepID=UPI00225E638A|nr:cobalt-precorrin-6A reductase [Sulfitobacter sp. F26204]MCX7558107.1 cobalt-precorrin-6A reductase [Sulfitobacter sp. F26204]